MIGFAMPVAINASTLNYIAPFRVAISVRLEERAERHDLVAPCPRILDGELRQSLADTLPAHAIWHTGVINDDQLLIGARKGHLRFITQSGELGYIAPFAAILFARDSGCCRHYALLDQARQRA